MKWFTALLILFTATAAFAQNTKSPTTPLGKWQEECGSCHIAYPPRFFSADNWQRVMSRLDKHFGTNAELDAEDSAIISEYLKRNSANRGQRASNTLRISDTAWFKHEHDEVPRRAWKDSIVKSPSNCAACHINAALGDWSEDGVRMPHGMHEEEDDD